MKRNFVHSSSNKALNRMIKTESNPENEYFQQQKITIL